ncbi:MAG: peptide deformylase [Candidatus Scalindua sp. AMX11]|nr:MAG: peptide deformylase [Candidatus Scalindua sp.]NOG85622.1 peptide deformylase [Planctomycetota bacterium]RZV82480.1 MAG: peptide deformylase [Candidatus Scalindua sp. SCAELEC01]TDE65594.1 MAG: peptide deformylase [Candidatus Scalindua sp. AMX11]GJQ59211.1 MAG: peptide deformylase [Candidatus Scalindua sp.]
MEVLIFPNPGLKCKAKPVEEIDEEIYQIADEMLKTMYDACGVGLAATQVGISKRLVVLDIEGNKVGERVFVNPYIVEQQGEIIEEEGCLSFPGLVGKVMRSQSVTVIAFNLKGERLQIKADGLLGRAWQHEIDHLNGTLFIEKMTPASMITNKQKIKEFETAYQENNAGVR